MTHADWLVIYRSCRWLADTNLEPWSSRIFTFLKKWKLKGRIGNLKHWKLLERKCIREDTSVDGIVIKLVSITILNVTAYACVLSDTFSLQEDILVAITRIMRGSIKYLQPFQKMKRNFVNWFVYDGEFSNVFTLLSNIGQLWKTQALVNFTLKL